MCAWCKKGLTPNLTGAEAPDVHRVPTQAPRKPKAWPVQGFA